MTEKNVSNKVVSNIDDGDVKVVKLTTQKSKKNVSNKVVSNIDDGGVKVVKLTNQKSKSNVSNKVVSNIDDGLDEKITTPITSKTKVTKNSKDAITYCISLFEKLRFNEFM